MMSIVNLGFTLSLALGALCLWRYRNITLERTLHRHVVALCHHVLAARDSGQPLKPGVDELAAAILDLIRKD